MFEPTSRRGIPAAIIAVSIAAFPLTPPAVAVPPKADGAAFGPFYDLGTPGGSESVGSALGNFLPLRFGDEFEINGPPGTSGVGPKWWFNWDDCPRGGSVVAELRWSATRSSSSLSPLYAFRVTDTGGTIFATTANLRDDLPAYPVRRNYGVATSGCKVQLRLDQVIAGGATEPARRYWVTSPRAIVRDVEPPRVVMGPLPGGWIGASTLNVNWSVSDNFDGQGVGNHHVAIDDLDRFVGYFRTIGDVGATVNLSDVPDGLHTVRVSADGDGTASGSQSGTIGIDRTSPLSTIWVTPLAPGRAQGRVDVTDPTPGSGTAGWQVEAPDGVVIASSARTGQDALSAIDLSRFDGQDVPLRLSVVDNAGNQAGSVATVRVDATAPAVAVTAAPSGWIPGPAVPLTLELSDNRADGVGLVEVSVNTAPDGSGSGQEIPIATVKVPQRGALALTPRVPPTLVDGVHRVRVVVRDPVFPAQLWSSAATVVRVDTGRPTIGPPDGWVLRPGADDRHYSLALPDVADATSGVAAVRVMANLDAAEGTGPAAYREVGSISPGDAAVVVPVDLGGFAEGRHATVIQVVDAAGNLAETPGPTLAVDRTAPVVTIVGVSADGVVTWRQVDAVGFGRCATMVEIQGPGTQGAWQPVFDVPGSSVPAEGGSVTLPLRGLAPGTYQVRVSACDGSGNRAAATATHAHSAEASGIPQGTTVVVSGPAAPAAPDLSGAHVVEVAVRTPAGDAVGESILDYGRRIQVTGRLVGPDGRGLAGITVRLLDSGGTWRAGARTERDGAFALTVDAVRGGRWTVTAVGSPTVSTGVALRVRVRMTTDLASRSLALGSSLVVRGRIGPGSAGSGKLVQLQWLDGDVWRPVVNAKTLPSGAFVATYRFKRSRGYSVSMRVVAPAERGWPFEAILGVPATIRVR